MAPYRGEMSRALFLLTTKIPCGYCRARPGAIRRGCSRPATRRDFHLGEGDSVQVYGWQAEIMQRPLTAEMHALTG